MLMLLMFVNIQNTNCSCHDFVKRMYEPQYAYGAHERESSQPWCRPSSSETTPLPHFSVDCNDLLQKTLLVNLTWYNTSTCLSGAVSLPDFHLLFQYLPKGGPKSNSDG